ncbi:MAG TPA: phosphate ABC transporter permease PstA [Stellaceae bacterium]|nr:phosphate ABC transporter permease PstA [Stellaceae bacterium]
MSPYARRRLVNTTVLTLSFAATAIGLIWLAAILWTLLQNGITAIDFDFFTQDTPGSGGDGGGLRNAIFGSLIMTALGTVVGAPIGILAGTFLAEFGRGNPLAPAVRFINDILLSAPSIIVGVFVYEAMVLRMGHYSAWAGSVALAIIVIPVVIRTTENMLNLVPGSLREAAYALGTPKWQVIVFITYRAAMQGMLTGVLLAVARVAGETAPLLFTVVNNQFWQGVAMDAQMANLPVVIFQFAMSPDHNWQRLAWGGALIITFAILILNISARLLANLRGFSK